MRSHGSGQAYDLPHRRPVTTAPLHLPQRVTAFAFTLNSEGRLLAVRHERLGVIRWELPGGHAEVGESFRAAAARETEEETGIKVRVNHLVAECRHDWRGSRRSILYFGAPVRSTRAALRSHGSQRFTKRPGSTWGRWTRPSPRRSSCPCWQTRLRAQTTLLFVLFGSPLRMVSQRRDGSR